MSIASITARSLLSPGMKVFKRMTNRGIRGTILYGSSPTNAAS